MNDVKGTPVELDCVAEGFVGALDVKAKGRIYFVSPWGWVAILTDMGNQAILYAGRFLIREGPRPANKRDDIPERLRR